jgi:hypothetical protein
MRLLAEIPEKLKNAHWLARDMKRNPPNFVFIVYPVVSYQFV